MVEKMSASGRKDSSGAARVSGNATSSGASSTRSAHLRIWRGGPDGGFLTRYEVPITEGMVVLDAIHWIQANVDSSLAVRWNCKAAHCGSCTAEVNGRPALTCKSRLDSFGDEEIEVRPMKTFPVIKDLVCDVSFNYRCAEKIPPFAPRTGAPRPFIMLQEDVERAQEFKKCIECFICQDVCHVLRDHKAPYYGPRYMVKIAQYEMHPMDGLTRTKHLKDEAGIGYCNITKCCEELCPEHITITDNAIIPLKERVVDDFYDPLTVIRRKLSKDPERV